VKPLTPPAEKAGPGAGGPGINHFIWIQNYFSIGRFWVFSFESTGMFGEMLPFSGEKYF
jgi:hypothetical protein